MYGGAYWDSDQPITAWQAIAARCTGHPLGTHRLLTLKTSQR